MWYLQSLIGILLKSDLPKTHIQQFHLRIREIIYFESLPCFFKFGTVSFVKKGQSFFCVVAYLPHI